MDRFIRVQFRIGPDDGYVNFRSAIVDTEAQRVVASCDREDDALAVAAALSAHPEIFDQSREQSREVPF